MKKAPEPDTYLSFEAGERVGGIEGMSEPGFALISLGMIGTYIGAIFVERHYTAFWTAFWNLSGLAVASLGFWLDATSQVDRNVFLVVVLALVIVLAVTLKTKRLSQMIRSLGSGLIVTSAALLLAAYFYWARWDIALVTAFANAFLVRFLRRRFLRGTGAGGEG